MRSVFLQPHWQSQRLLGPGRPDLIYAVAGRAGAPPLAKATATPEANGVELSGFGRWTPGARVMQTLWGDDHLIMALQV